jgi:hypothetical protein
VPLVRHERIISAMTSQDDSPIFIDFEASSLGAGSFPIEVAWSRPDGSIGSYSIRPLPEWIDWDDYTEQKIHHISRAIARSSSRSAGFATVLDSSARCKRPGHLGSFRSDANSGALPSESGLRRSPRSNASESIRNASSTRPAIASDSAA